MILKVYPTTKCQPLAGAAAAAIAQASSASIVGRNGPILAVQFVVDLATLSDGSQKMYLLHVLSAMGLDVWWQLIVVLVVRLLVFTVTDRERAGIHEQS